jgi:hypothetical protein
MATYTELETQALAALNIESDSNGHDFGVLEYVEWADRQQLGGLLTSLQQKGAVTGVDTVTVGDDVLTQYVLAEAVRA